MESLTTRESPADLAPLITQAVCIHSYIIMASQVQDALHQHHHLNAPLTLNPFMGITSVPSLIEIIPML